jgi:hypothetical protein
VKAYKAVTASNDEGGNLKARHVAQEHTYLRDCLLRQPLATTAPEVQHGRTRWQEIDQQAEVDGAAGSSTSSRAHPA